MEIANLQSEEYGSRFLFFLVGSRSMDDGSRVYMSMVYNELRWHSHMVNYCSFIPFVGLKLEVNSLPDWWLLPGFTVPDAPGSACCRD